MANCERDDEGFVVDPITYEPVPEYRVISFDQLGVTFCFDVQTLADFYESSGRFQNPINRQPLPDDVILQIESYMVEDAQQINIIPDVGTTQYSGKFKQSDKIGDIVFRISNVMPSLIPNGYNIRIESKSPTSIGWKINYAYSYPLDTPLRDLIARNASDVRVTIDNTDNERSEIFYRELYDRIYKYALSVNRRDIIALIPARYIPYIPESPNSLDQEIIAEFILDNTITHRKSDNYIILGLTRLLDGSKISARFANAIMRELSKRIYTNNTMNAAWVPVLYLLYSRVVDPSKLSQTEPIQERYYLPESQRPSFTSMYGVPR